MQLKQTFWFFFLIIVLLVVANNIDEVTLRETYSLTCQVYLTEVTQSWKGWKTNIHGVGKQVMMENLIIHVGILGTFLTRYLINKQNSIYMYPIDVSRVLEEINKLETVNLKSKKIKCKTLVFHKKKKIYL